MKITADVPPALRTTVLAADRPVGSRELRLFAHDMATRLAICDGFTVEER